MLYVAIFSVVALCVVMAALVVEMEDVHGR